MDKRFIKENYSKALKRFNVFKWLSISFMILYVVLLVTLFVLLAFKTPLANLTGIGIAFAISFIGLAVSLFGLYVNKEKLYELYAHGDLLKLDLPTVQYVNHRYNGVNSKILKEEYGQTLKLLDVFKWVTLALVTLVCIYLVVIIASLSNINQDILTTNLEIFIILAVLCAFAGALWVGFKFKLNKIRNEGNSLDKGFNVLLDDFDLRSTDRNSKITAIIAKNI